MPISVKIRETGQEGVNLVALSLTIRLGCRACGEERHMAEGSAIVEATRRELVARFGQPSTKTQKVLRWRLAPWLDLVFNIIMCLMLSTTMILTSLSLFAKLHRLDVYYLASVKSPILSEES